ncbi:MAG: DUF262 domain-containing protein [Muricomes sp.]
MVKKPRIYKPSIPYEKQLIAEKQIKDTQKQIDYDTIDFTIEHLIMKFEKGDFFIPPYQRNFIWREENKSAFIESVILGLPIPFMFFGNCNDGRMEVIDGAQRLQTLSAFVENKLKLKGLKKLESLNNFTFKDLLESQQRKLINRTLRIIVLEEDTPNDIRQDLFNRINTSGIKANPSEIRRGSYPGTLTDFIDECTKNELFQKLCPISAKSVERHERFEFILRFFAYTNSYMEFVHEVNTFLDEFLVDNMENADIDEYSFEFNRMLNFVDTYFPHGFTKTPNANSTPRVRFEAISVGVALALREKPDLVLHDLAWLKSDEFKYYTTTDASNNLNKFRGRIEYVKAKILGEDYARDTRDI